MNVPKNQNKCILFTTASWSTNVSLFYCLDINRYFELIMSGKDCAIYDAPCRKQLQEYPCIKAAVERCSVKKVLLEISQNSQENTCAKVSFIIKLINFIKKETATRGFL